MSLAAGGGEEQAADGRADAEEFFPIGGVGEAEVVDEGVGLEFDAVARDMRGAGDEHLDADAGERAAFGEAEGRDVHLEGLEFGRMAGPEGEREGDGALVLVFYSEDLAVLAGPKLIGVHF